MAQLLKGKPVIDALVADTSARAAGLRRRGMAPTLAIVRVGEDASGVAYERGAMKRMKSCGIDVRRFMLPANCTQARLLDAIGRVNDDSRIHGCLMLRPLPKSLDEQEACAALSPAKDVDGITPGSLYGVFANVPAGFAPCTPEACLHILDHYGYGVEGKKVVVIGRSLVVGKPVSLMLQARNATVTMCHTRTRDLASICRAADVLVVAAGHPETVRADAASPGQVVIDVGVNWDDAAGRLVGDVAFAQVEPIVAAITPVPGGVGSVTTAVLAHHVVQAAERLAWPAAGC